MTAAIDAYLEVSRAKGCTEGTVTTKGYRLRALHAGVRTVEDLTPARCAQLYAARTRATRGGRAAPRRGRTPVPVRPIAADTHRKELEVAKAFGAWLVKQGWARKNPWAGVEPVGWLSQGKEQLRINEARAFYDLALEQAWAGDGAAAGVLVALVMGMRSKEVLRRVVRDLDDGGRVLWIGRSKTKAGKRHLEVPAELRPLLLELAKGRPAEAPLIERREGEHGSKDWLYYHTHRLCKLAGVPVVCVHSLRGLHSTLATEEGATAAMVMRALGHASTAVGKKHYIRSEAAHKAATERTMRVLQGGQR